MNRHHKSRAATRRQVLHGVMAAVSATAAAQRPAQAAAPLTLVLDWLLNPNHAAIFAADHLGEFARAGLAVDIVAPSDADLPTRMLAAGRADLAVGYGSQINLLDAAGLGLVRIATLIDAPLNTLTALGDGHIRHIADLRGATIGFNVAGVEEAMLAVMLRDGGVDPARVRRVKLSYDLVGALLARRIDAAIGAYRNVEVIQLRAAGQSPIVFLPEQHGVPPYDELILLARKASLADPRLKAFVGALTVATQRLKQAPDALWHALAAAHPELDTPVNALSWQATMPYIAADPGALNAARYERFQDFALAEGIIQKRQSLPSFAVSLG